ncbi:hypothetical protein B0H19DRAFT_181705 [Mycena capillaripes]|nr:hypothetical protein B0H19DRAFT_181705 [Mycena capillaripes]
MFYFLFVFRMSPPCADGEVCFIHLQRIIALTPSAQIGRGAHLELRFSPPLGGASIPSQLQQSQRQRLNPPCSSINNYRRNSLNSFN